MSAHHKPVKLLLDPMLGRFIETSLVVSANRSGLGNLIVLRANASKLLPDVLLTDDFRILRFARRHEFILVTCNTKDTQDRFPAIHQAYQRLEFKHPGILCCQQLAVDRNPYQVVSCLMSWLHAGAQIDNQCLHLRPVPTAFENPMPFRGTEEELTKTLQKVRIEEQRPYPTTDPLLQYTAQQWEELTVANRMREE